LRQGERPGQYGQGRLRSHPGIAGPRSGCGSPPAAIPPGLKACHRPSAEGILRPSPHRTVLQDNPTNRNRREVETHPIDRRVRVSPPRRLRGTPPPTRRRPRSRGPGQRGPRNRRRRSPGRHRRRRALPVPRRRTLGSHRGDPHRERRLRLHRRLAGAGGAAARGRDPDHSHPHNGSGGRRLPRLRSTSPGGDRRLVPRRAPAQARSGVPRHPNTAGDPGRPGEGGGRRRKLSRRFDPGIVSRPRRPRG